MNDETSDKQVPSSHGSAAVTPRVDEEVEIAKKYPGTAHGLWVSAEFARQLERELAEERAGVKRWQQIADQRAIEVADLKHDLSKALANHSADLSAREATFVSVKDKLPENDDMVVVRDADGQFAFDYYENGKWQNICEDQGEPVEWYPLPKTQYVKVCAHGKALNDYCEPCGRIHGG